MKTTRSISPSILQEWIGKKKYNQDRLNRIRKKIKKLLKQEKHFEMRLRLVKEHECECRSIKKEST
jgi:hypothetical protein